MFPKPTYKRGGTNPSKSKPSKNDRAMVSGVSSILRKIKDKKNRKEVAGSMVNQFNREGVNYNKEKFLKNSRSFQGGGTNRPIYTSNLYDSRLKAYNDSLFNYKLVSEADSKMRKALQNSKTGQQYNKEFERLYKLYKSKGADFVKGMSIKNPLPISKKYSNNSTGYYSSGIPIKPVQPVFYKPAPKRKTMTTMSKTPVNNSASNRYVKRIEPKEESTTPITTPITPTQTPKQVSVNSSQTQRYNYMSTEDKKRAVKKYGDPSKVPNEGVDINQLRKEVPTFQAGGTRKPIYVSDPRDPRLRRYNDSLSGYRLTRAMEPLFRVDPMNETLKRYNDQAENFVRRTGIKPTRLRTYNGDEYNYRDVNIELMQEPYLGKFKKPVQPVKYADPKIVEKQKLLKDAGLYSGELDGIWGSGSKKAWKEYTEKNKPTSSTTSTTTATSRTTTTPSTSPKFNIKGIIADQYVPDSKNPNSIDYRYRVETDKGFDIIQGKKAFDEWKEKNASEYQPYYKKSTNAPIDYNKGRINEYLEKPTLSYKSGGQHGGLDRWFAEKWVDVKSGKACGRQKGESRAYPACRPSKRISSKTPKTSSELSSQEKARFKSTKTSSQRIPYNHKRK